MKKHPNFGPVTTPLELIDAALARARAAEEEQPHVVHSPRKPASGRRRRVIQALKDLKQRNREMAAKG